jgi:hypothetical protein
MQTFLSDCCGGHTHNRTRVAARKHLAVQMNTVHNLVCSLRRDKTATGFKHLSIQRDIDAQVRHSQLTLSQGPAYPRELKGC